MGLNLTVFIGSLPSLIKTTFSSLNVLPYKKLTSARFFPSLLPEAKQYVYLPKATIFEFALLGKGITSFQSNQHELFSPWNVFLSSTDPPDIWKTPPVLFTSSSPWEMSHTQKKKIRLKEIWMWTCAKVHVWARANWRKIQWLRRTKILSTH